jgi:signal peptidase I
LTTFDESTAAAASGDPVEPVRRHKSAGQQAAAFLRELLIVVVGAIIVSSLLRAFVGQMFIIPSTSMENTLLIGDRVVVQKITDFHRGDVVVFSDPGGWLDGEPVTEPTAKDRVLEFIGIPTQSTPGHLIKRVIGLPGDKVVCCDADGRLTVNGYPLDESSYLYSNRSGEQVAPAKVPFTVVVPEGRIFVMGDHRNVSADSRCHLSDISLDQRKGQVAFVPIDRVVGPAIAIAAPFDRTSRLRHFTTFDGVPDPTSPAPAEGVIEPEGVSC